MYTSAKYVTKKVDWIENKQKRSRQEDRLSHNTDQERFSFAITTGHSDGSRERTTVGPLL